MGWLQRVPVTDSLVTRWSLALGIPKGLMWQALESVTGSASGQSSFIWYGDERLGLQRILLHKYFYGESGCGKSTLIELLRKIFAETAEILRDAAKDAGYPLTAKQLNPVIEAPSSWPECAKEIKERKGQGVILFPEQSMSSDATISLHNQCFFVFLVFVLGNF